MAFALFSGVARVARRMYRAEGAVRGRSHPCLSGDSRRAVRFGHAPALRRGPSHRRPSLPLHPHHGGRGSGRDDRGRHHRPALGAAAQAHPPAAERLVGLPDGGAQPLRAQPGDDAPRRRARAPGLPDAARGRAGRSLTAGRRGDAAPGRPPARRRPRSVQPLLRRGGPLPPVRARPRAALAAHHRGGAGGGHRGSAQEPERSVRRRGGRRSATRGAPDPRRRDGRAEEEPSAPRWVELLHRALSGAVTVDNMDYVRRDAYQCGVAAGPSRRGPADLLHLLHRRGTDVPQARPELAARLLERALLHVRERLLPPHLARHRPAPHGDLPGHDALSAAGRPALRPRRRTSGSPSGGSSTPSSAGSRSRREARSGASPRSGAPSSTAT